MSPPSGARVNIDYQELELPGPIYGYYALVCICYFLNMHDGMTHAGWTIRRRTHAGQYNGLVHTSFSLLYIVQNTYISSITNIKRCEL